MNRIFLYSVLAALTMMAASCQKENNEENNSSVAALLPGKFSVSATKKVQFTSGNLYWDGSTFKLESSQTAYPTTWDESHVGNFFWTKTIDDSYVQEFIDTTKATTDRFFADGLDADHMLTVGDQSNLYVLSNAEWIFLFNTRTNASSLYKFNVTVNGVGDCLVIAPDDFSGTIKDSYDAAKWTVAEASGLVCLPPTPDRIGVQVFSIFDTKSYWAATPRKYAPDLACCLTFASDVVYPDATGSRDYGFAIRLVSTACD